MRLKKASFSIDKLRPGEPHLRLKKPTLNGAVGLFRRLSAGYCRRLFLCAVTCSMIGLLALMAFGCKDRKESPSAVHWDRVVNGENNELYYIDRKAIERISDDIVRVSVKYAPTKGQFLISLQELSKEFGSADKDMGQEYTISTWEFSCEKPEGRCLNLTHYKKGSKVAFYEYPHPDWTTLHNAPSTKMLRDLVCAEIAPSKLQK